MDLDVYALLNKKLKGVASGIKSISFENGILKFTTNDGVIINVTVPNMHTHNNKSILDKLSVIDGKLYYEDLLIDGHSHSNKSVLDSITQEDVSKWNDGSKYVVKSYLEEQLVGKSPIEHAHDDLYYDKATIDKKISDIEGSGSSSDLSNYYTKTEIDDKNRQKVDKIDGKSLVSDTEIERLSSVTNYVHPTNHPASIIIQDSYNRFVTDVEKAIWSAKSSFNGDYATLTNKPTIPAVGTLNTSNTSAQITASSESLSGAINLHKVAKSGTYSDLLGLPTLLAINDTTSSGVSVYSSNKTDALLSSKAPTMHSHTITDLPTGATGTTVALGNHTHSGVYEPVMSTKNTAFNVNFETTSTNIKMNGTQSLGVLSTVARADHVHASDISKVNTSTTINGNALTSNITLTLDNINDGTTRKLANYALSNHNHDASYFAIPTVTTITIASNTCTLTTAPKQYVVMATGITIVLPAVSTYTEISLFFSCSADLTLTFPSIKWQNAPESKSGKTYEYCFTWVNATIGWIGGWISYA